MDKTRRDPERVGRLLASLARNVSTYAPVTALRSDAAGEDGQLKRDTVVEYLSALKRLMIIEDQPAWAPHMRSRYAQRSGVKRHFVDPSLAVAALRATPATLLKDFNLLGFLFESLVVRDLRVYSQAHDAEVLQYRDNSGLEIDAVIRAADGRWIPCEVKLGVGQVDTGAASLLKFAKQVDTKKCGEPAALMVVTGTGYGYVRKDGVAVVPIGALGP